MGKTGKNFWTFPSFISLSLNPEDGRKKINPPLPLCIQGVGVSDCDVTLIQHFKNNFPSKLSVQKLLQGFVYILVTCKLFLT